MTLIKSTGDGFESLRANQPHASKAHRSGAQATRGGLRFLNSLQIGARTASAAVSDSFADPSDVCTRWISA